MSTALVPSIGQDPNGAGWYGLRYARDFTGYGAGPGIQPWQLPVLGPELLFDDSRHVLELRPSDAPGKRAPLPGLAVDVTGEIYTTDARGLLVRRCNGCESAVVCEPGVFIAPAGLALDRRGFLYVADPGAGRVVVVSPDDGSVISVLVDRLKKPVDVAVAPSGTIYVADEEAGEISVWSARFEWIGAFKAITRDGLPVHPHPIAVFVEADGSIGVIDASHPRVLRFGSDGSSMGDIEPRRLAADLPDAPLALDALRCIYGAAPFHIVAGACGPCAVPDGASRLVLAHRNLRLIGLTLSGQFATSGTFVSAALDGGIPGTVWHKVVIHGDVPAGTWLEVQVVAADDPTALDDPNLLPAGMVFCPAPGVHNADGSPRLPDGVRDALILCPPGRYARIRITLGGDGTATPSVRLIQAFFPRVSYLDLLPRVFQRDTDAERFLERFLALFEHVLTHVEARYEDFSRQLDLDAARPSILTWLGELIDVTFEPSWLPARRRALLREAVRLYQIRGTPAGVSRYLEIYTGRPPILVEHWLDREAETPGLGRAGSVLGLGSLAAPPRGSDADRAHRFSVYVESDDPALDETLLAMARRIVDTSKPAHTSYDLHLLRPGEATVGEGRVGFDLIVDSREVPRLELGGCTPKTDAPPSGATLGVDAVLGPPRPEFNEPFGLTL